MILFIRQSIIALCAAALLYGTLWLATGFDPFATFFAAVHNQRELLAHLILPRRWPSTIPADFQDFFFGSAWVSLPLMIFWFMRRDRSRVDSDEARVRRLVVLGITQIVVVALTGLLPGESARVWMFMQPLALAPIALELSRWKPWQCGCALAIVAIVTAIAAQNMIFLAG